MLQRKCGINKSLSNSRKIMTKKAKNEDDEKNVYPDCKRAHKNEECSTSVTIVNFLLKYLSYTQIHTHLVINQEYLFLYILRFIIFEDFAYSFTV